MITNNVSDRSRRRSIRLRGLDYSNPGCYFITICAFHMRCIFGSIRNARQVLSPLGGIVRRCWLEVPYHFPNVDIDAFVIMPNHLHGILVIKERARRAVPLRDNSEAFQHPVIGSIPTIVRSFKAAVTKMVRDKSGDHAIEVWQSNYFERVLRDGDEFSKASRYIHENPSRWRRDIDNPLRRGTALPCPSSISPDQPRSLR